MARKSAQLAMLVLLLPLSVCLAALLVLLGKCSPLEAEVIAMTVKLVRLVLQKVCKSAQTVISAFTLHLLSQRLAWLVQWEVFSLR